MFDEEISKAKQLAKNYDDDAEYGDGKLLANLASGLSSRSEVEDKMRGITGADLKQLGKAILLRWSRSFHQLICGNDSADSHFRDEVLNAISGRQALGPVLAGIAVAAFGLSAGVAAIIGTLLARYVIGPTIEEVCLLWDAKIQSAI